MTHMAGLIECAAAHRGLDGGTRPGEALRLFGAAKGKNVGGVPVVGRQHLLPMRPRADHVAVRVAALQRAQPPSGRDLYADGTAGKTKYTSKYVQRSRAGESGRSASMQVLTWAAALGMAAGSGRGSAYFCISSGSSLSAEESGWSGPDDCSTDLEALPVGLRREQGLGQRLGRPGPSSRSGAPAPSPVELSGMPSPVSRGTGAHKQAQGPRSACRQWATVATGTLAR